MAASDEQGRSEVFLRTFPDKGGLWQVSVEGGAFPRWSRDGRHLYFLQDELAVYEVDVTLEPAVRLSNPRLVFTSDAHKLGPNHGWDVVGAGERFVTIEMTDAEAGTRDLTLITNWRP